MNIAGLYSLAASCEANDVASSNCLRDVLLRISTHPARPEAWEVLETLLPEDFPCLSLIRTSV